MFASASTSERLSASSELLSSSASTTVYETVSGGQTLTITAYVNPRVPLSLLPTVFLAEQGIVFTVVGLTAFVLLIFIGTF